MTGRRSLLGWLLNLPPPPPSTRLNRAEAVALATAAAQERLRGRTLSMATVRLVSGRPVWRISSPTIGAQWWVDVDDETGVASALHEAGSF